MMMVNSPRYLKKPEPEAVEVEGEVEVEVQEPEPEPVQEPEHTKNHQRPRWTYNTRMGSCHRRSFHKELEAEAGHLMFRL